MGPCTHGPIGPGAGAGPWAGAILGAGSVVTKDVAPFTIVAGNPAREIRKRFSEEKIKKIQEAEWWYWSLEKMQKNSDFFNNGENI